MYDKNVSNHLFWHILFILYYLVQLTLSYSDGHNLFSHLTFCFSSPNFPEREVRPLWLKQSFPCRKYTQSHVHCKDEQNPAQVHPWRGAFHPEMGMVHVLEARASQSNSVLSRPQPCRISGCQRHLLLPWHIFFWCPVHTEGPTLSTV